ncbi:MAG: hypothetical protein ACLVH3_00485 [Blautia obeum]
MSNAKTVVKRKKGDWRIAVLFLLPSLILLGLFVFWPMVDSIHMSFYDWNPLKGKIFTGLENYQNLLKDKLLVDKSGQHDQVYPDECSANCHFFYHYV